MSIDSRRLTAEWGSPLYVYQMEDIRDAHRSLASALPSRSRILYSLKANPHLTLVTELGRLGCGAEVSSLNELRIALRAGIPAERCLYTGPAKRTRDIAAALAMGVPWFSVDSPSEFDKVAACAVRAGQRCAVLIRVNSGGGAASAGLNMGGGASQFGADGTWIREQPGAFRSRGKARLAGFHFFLATNVRDHVELMVALGAAAQEAPTLAHKLDVEPEVVDLGGGFANPYATSGNRPDYSGLRPHVTSLLDSCLSGWRHGRPEIWFESGRYLVGCAGVLLCTVLDVKCSRDRRFVVVDSGINHLGGMTGLRRAPQIVPTVDVAGAVAGTGIDWEADLVGPLCTPLDSWARRLPLPPVKPGDVLAIPNVGAYGLTASLLGFLGHDAPMELVLERGEVVHASRLVLERKRASDLED